MGSTANPETTRFLLIGVVLSPKDGCSSSKRCVDFFFFPSQLSDVVVNSLRCRTIVIVVAVLVSVAVVLLIVLCGLYAYCRNRGTYYSHSPLFLPGCCHTRPPVLLLPVLRLTVPSGKIPCCRRLHLGFLHPTICIVTVSIPGSNPESALSRNSSSRSAPPCCARSPRTLSPPWQDYLYACACSHMRPDP